MIKKIAVTVAIVMLLFGILPCCRASAEEESEKTAVESTEEDASSSDEYAVGEDGKSEAYKDIKDKVWNSTDETLNELMEGAKETGRNITDGIWKYVFYMYDVVSAVYPGVFFFSILIGSVVAVMSNKNKKVRKRAVVIGIITIPVVLTAVVYILPYIYIRLS